MPDQPVHEPEVLHQLKNHLSIVVGFSELLLAELPDGDARHADLLEMHNAARAAIALMPALARHLR